MGCSALPNRVEHYHHPRMLMLCLDAFRAIDERRPETSFLEQVADFAGLNC